MVRANIFETTIEHFLAPVMPFMRDPSVAEIMINSPREIYVERSGKLLLTDAVFADESTLLAAVKNILQFTGKRLDEMHPLVDSRLPDGSRVHVVLDPISRKGTCMTIRKFAQVNFSPDHLVDLGSWTPLSMEYLRLCVLAERNILVSGGTSSGKTSLLNVLSTFVPSHERIVVIEDSAELELQQQHVIGLEGRPADRWGRGEVTVSDLFKSSLRLRPDRIIIGEVRGGEALDMIQAMTSGHAGSMSTLHATMPMDALNRLETLAMMNKVELPLHALRSQIASAIDVIVQVMRFSDGRRGLTQISEVLPLGEDGHYRVCDLFEFQYAAGLEGKAGRGGLVYTGRKSIFRDHPKIRLLQDDWGVAGEIFTHDKPAGEAG